MRPWERRAIVALIAAPATGWLIAGFVRLGGARIAGPAGARPAVAPTPMRRSLEEKLDSLSATMARLDAAVGRRDRDARALYREARRLYKEEEFLTAFYAPTIAGMLNGPGDVDDADLPPRPLGQRAGLGIVEAALFADSSPARAWDDAAAASRGMLRSIATFRSATRWLEVSDTASLDAARLELARVMTVGIAGFDTELSGDALTESAAALDGIAAGVLRLKSAAIDSAARARTAALLVAAASDLRSGGGFDAFDRFAFITDRATPAAKAVLGLRQLIDGRPPAIRRLWRPSAATPFDASAFDVWALAPEFALRGSPALVALGEKLFNDPRLSGPQTRSCASCHLPRLAFTDGVRRAPSFDTAAVLRNTPTLLNAALQPAMFADQRVGFVEDQIRVVLASGAEMASSAALAAKRVARDTTYAPLMRRALGPWAALDERAVSVALAAYVRSLTALDAPFDRAIRGDRAAIGADAKRGFNLFMGKARCGTCHFAPLFGGTMPPDYIKSELEIIGVPASPGTTRPRLDADVGRERVDGFKAHRGAFRVPSLRNVALTAPYMHNGGYPSLDDVIDFYDRGGGAGIGEVLPAQTLSTRPLHLSRDERRDLVSFLNTLTDTVVRVANP